MDFGILNDKNLTPKIKLPKVNLPKYKPPKLKIPKVKLPKISLTGVISKEGRVRIPAKRKHEVEEKYHNKCAVCKEKPRG